MNIRLEEEHKKTLVAGAIVAIGLIMATIIITKAGEDVKFAKEESSVSDSNNTITTKHQFKKTTRIKDKASSEGPKELSLEEIYDQRPKYSTFNGKEIFLSIDNNGNPCYLLNSKFLSKNGNFVPLNYIPANMKCENINIILKDNTTMVKIDSLDAMLNSNKIPKGYKFYLKGDGIDSVIENCGDYWSDRCLSIPKAKILISLEGPEALPRVTSMDTLVLTKKGLIDGINTPSIKYKKNENFYLWRKVPFPSPYAINGLIDGEYVNGAKEAYKLAPQIAIDMKLMKVYTRTYNDMGICFYNKDNFPINIDGESIPIKEIPPSIKCEDLKVKNGNLYLADLDSITNYTGAKKGTKIGTTINEEYFVLEKCGNYWADSCKNGEERRVVVTSGDRTMLPPPKSNKRLSLTKKLGKQKRNTLHGIKHQSGYYVWSKEQIDTSVAGMADVPICKNKNCYQDLSLLNVSFAKSGKKLVRKITNRNGLKLWVSTDRRRILSPYTMRWSRIKNIDIPTGIAENGMIFTNLNKTADIFKAKKLCGELGMRLPSLEEVSIENKNGVYSNEWAWTNQIIDNEFYTAWKEQSLLKANNEDKFNVICVER